MHIFRKYWCFLLSSLITCLSGIVVVISVRFLQCILPGQQVVLGLIRGRLSNVLKLHREVEPLICLWVKHNRNRPSKLFQYLVLKILKNYMLLRYHLQDMYLFFHKIQMDYIDIMFRNQNYNLK